MGINKIAVKECLRSGFCCTKSPCGYGAVTSNTNPACKYLVPHPDKRTSCGKYDEIIKDPNSKFSPAFGFGCCMPLGNGLRNDIRDRLFEGKEQYIDIDNYLYESDSD